MTTFKKIIHVEKDTGSGSDRLPKTIEELPKFKEFEEYKQKLISEGKIIKWERTPLDSKGNCTISIEVDEPETYQLIIDFSQSLGDWKDGFRLFDTGHNELP